MVDSASSHLDRVFRALSDPTRREMIALLSRSERSVTELAEPFEISLAGVSKHVKGLEEAGLVRRQWRGREARCRLDPAALRAADRWLARYRDALLRKRGRRKEEP
ncbi:MAG TPA: metalloregulator ArsR/SmtB family transcription factor [Myxococcaceae bacterium]|nr:metalloregulator ArsR/SmtB family transcription factor [Myxococcaceae bacterium]